MTFYQQILGFFFVLFALVSPNLLSNACSVNELQNCTQNNNTECCRLLNNPLWMLEVGLFTGKIILVSFLVIAPKRGDIIILFAMCRKKETMACRMNVSH